ncbi:MAG: HDOD domain-containing protein, partial [Methylococcales bacterium]|nr:HDOD domain-containing protein [Methylococcales bacterium]
MEKEIFGFDYAQLGSELLKLWEVPTILYQTHQYHTNIQQADQYVPRRLSENRKTYC